MELHQLKQQGLVWNFDHYQATQRQPTGFAALDTLLLGGWPTHDLIEIVSAGFCGENRLFWPWLCQMHGLRFWINPPASLYGAALPQAIRPYCLQIDTQSHADALWSTEQCLQSGSAGAVLLWLHQPLNIHQCKKLQLAAHSGRTPLLLFTPPQQHRLPLPLAVSLELQATPEGLQLHVKKLKGARTGASCLLPWRELFPLFDDTSAALQLHWHQVSGL